MNGIRHKIMCAQKESNNDSRDFYVCLAGTQMAAARKLETSETAEIIIGRLILGVMDNDVDAVLNGLRELKTIGRRNMRGATLLTFVVGDVSRRSLVLILDAS